MKAQEIMFLSKKGQIYVLNKWLKTVEKFTYGFAVQQGFFFLHKLLFWNHFPHCN